MPANQDDREALARVIDPYVFEPDFAKLPGATLRQLNALGMAQRIIAAGFTRSAKDEGWVACSPRQFEAMANELAKRISENVRLAAEVKLFRTFADAKACRNVDNALPAPPIAAPTTQAYLQAKADAAGELYEAGQITRAECFKHEVDVAVQRNSGPITAPPTQADAGEGAAGVEG